jgi:hypothetical protein
MVSKAGHWRIENAEISPGWQLARQILKGNQKELSLKIHSSLAPISLEPLCKRLPEAPHARLCHFLELNWMKRQIPPRRHPAHSRACDFPFIGRLRHHPSISC